MSGAPVERTLSVAHPLAPTPRPLADEILDALIDAVLREDLGERGDVTTGAIVPDDARGTARLVARQAGRLAGIGVAARVFRRCDPAIEISLDAADGEDVGAGASLARISGPLAAMLRAERTALNFLGRLSGVATTTRDLGALTGGSGARLCDTRKTTPGLRLLEKYAVRCGGGLNHRFGLDDAILVKDNHVVAAGSITAAVERARAAFPDTPMEVEVDTLQQLDEALAAGADVVLLDNFSLEDLRTAVHRTAGRARLEASGNVGPDSIGAIARTGVDFISAGWITHSAPALDVALEIESARHAPRAPDGATAPG